MRDQEHALLLKPKMFEMKQRWPEDKKALQCWRGITSFMYIVASFSENMKMVTY